MTVTILASWRMSNFYVLRMKVNACPRDRHRDYALKKW